MEYLLAELQNQVHYLVENEDFYADVLTREFDLEQRKHIQNLRLENLRKVHACFNALHELQGKLSHLIKER